MRSKINPLFFELIAVFTLLPAFIYFMGSHKVMLGTLWIGSLVAWFALKHEKGFSIRKEWSWAGVTRANLKFLIIRFVPCAIILLVFVLVEIPADFLVFPRTRTGLWLLVMLLYPILSVVPQSFVFRSFFFHRYEKILGSQTAIISGLAFGYAHFFLGNAIAILICIIGGVIFADTYKRYRSLALVSIEHSIYGCYVFTIGLGKYFYSGAHLH
jgi:membrane protease YdiL (CAAX protease family)